MSGPRPPQIDDRRRGERAPLPARVVVRVRPQEVSGPGQNVSEEGVCFVCDQPILVEVELADATSRIAEIVRAQSMGDGRTGLALKFV